jgi:hypothetical protein
VCHFVINNYHERLCLALQASLLAQVTVIIILPRCPCCNCPTLLPAAAAAACC